MNRLTSMAYPDYKVDLSTMGAISDEEGTELDSFTRMKPPIVKFRLGDLYGRQNKEVTGFVKMLTYTVPETAVWETDENRRIPKSVNVTMTYQVIHDHTPQLAFSSNPGRVGGEAFYGANMNIANGNSMAGESFGSSGPSVRYINKSMVQMKPGAVDPDTNQQDPASVNPDSLQAGDFGNYRSIQDDALS